jgi:heat shock protein HslJ
MFRLFLILAIAAAIASCADRRQSVELPGTTWQVQDIAGEGVIDRAVPELTFRPGGQVTGSSGCNSIVGSYVLEGDRLTISALAQTKRACAEAVMEQEGRFTSLMTGQTRVEVAEDGALALHAREGIVRFVRQPGNATP